MRCFATGYFVQAPNISLPGGNFLRSHVTTGVLGEVIAAHESAVTHGTHKLFLAGMCSPVTGELVRAGKPFITAVPAAAERLLA